MTDLPGQLRFGRLSLMGLCTIVEAALLGIVLVSYGTLPKRLLRSALPYGLFLVWAGLSVLWAPPDIEGAQNGAVYLMFGLAFFVAATAAARSGAALYHVLRRAMTAVDLTAWALVGGSLALRGWEADWFVGQRSIALLGLLALSWHLAGSYYRCRYSSVRAVIWLVIIVLSSSRTASGVGLLLVAGAFLLDVRFKPRRAIARLPIVMALLTGSVALVTLVTPFYDHFFSGDTSIAFGDMQVNANGRLEFWKATERSALEQPIVGKGLGSSQLLISELFPGIGHPHNDYLRIWHDLGVVGVTLWITSVTGWLWLLTTSWYRAERRRTAVALQLSGLLGLVSLTLVMITDNAVIYPFVMGPLGVLLGAAVGLSLSSRGLATGRQDRGATLERSPRSYLQPIPG